MKTRTNTKEQSSSVSFSPLKPVKESVAPGKLYIWQREEDFMMVRLNKKRDGLEDMTTSFPRRDEWYFEDNLIGCLYGPVIIENATSVQPEGD